VRSNHALLGWLALLMLVLFGLARDGYPIVAYTAAGLFVVCSLGVFARFFAKGPEADRLLPSITVSSNLLEIANIDAEFAAELMKLGLKHQKALPPPTGIVQGLSSDPNAIKILSPEESAHLALSDAKGPPVLGS